MGEEPFPGAVWALISGMTLKLLFLGTECLSLGVRVRFPEVSDPQPWAGPELPGSRAPSAISARLCVRTRARERGRAHTQAKRRASEECACVCVHASEDLCMRKCVREAVCM